MRLRPPKWLLSLTLAIGALSTLTGSEGIRLDELRCEEAKKRLIDCCGPGFDANQIDCRYQPNGCGTDADGPGPTLDSDYAACIRDDSCQDLVLNACGNPNQFRCD